MTAVDPALRTTSTTCPYCGVGCGVLATPDGNGGAAISGDPSHPANLGRLCSKGSALGETLGLENRLLYPMVRCSNGAMERVAWTDALDHVAHRFAHIVARDGPGAVAFYLSGQLLTEDYYVANKLMKGFIGSANVDTNSRLCMASSVAGHRRAFGADTVPGVYEDLDEADLLVLVGSNAAWCHPVLFQRMIANKQRRGARIVVIDPRKTDTSEDADLFLGVEARHRYRTVFRIAGASRRQRFSRPRLHRAPYDRLRRSARACPRHRRQRCGNRFGNGPCPNRTSRRSSRCLRRRRAWSRSIRKASISRRRAPTRSTRS